MNDHPETGQQEDAPADVAVTRATLLFYTSRDWNAVTEELETMYESQDDDCRRSLFDLLMCTLGDELARVDRLHEALKRAEVSCRTLTETSTYYLGFSDGSEAAWREGAGWHPFNPDVGSDLWKSGRYFRDSMAVEWCDTWHERFPGLVGFGQRFR